MSSCSLCFNVCWRERLTLLSSLLIFLSVCLCSCMYDCCIPVEVRGQLSGVSSRDWIQVSRLRGKHLDHWAISPAVILAFDTWAFLTFHFDFFFNVFFFFLKTRTLLSLNCLFSGFWFIALFLQSLFLSEGFLCPCWACGFYIFASTPLPLTILSHSVAGWGRAAQPWLVIALEGREAQELKGSLG